MGRPYRQWTCWRQVIYSLRKWTAIIKLTQWTRWVSERHLIPSIKGSFAQSLVAEKFTSVLKVFPLRGHKMDSLNNAIPLWRKYLNFHHRSFTVTINSIKYSAEFAWKIKRWLDDDVTWKWKWLALKSSEITMRLKIRLITNLTLFKCQMSEVDARNIALDLE